MTSQEKRVLRELPLVLCPQEIIGVVDHNGSGKTMILQLLARLMYPKQDETVFAEVQWDDVGFLIDKPHFVERLSGFDNIESAGSTVEEIQELMAMFGLDPHCCRPVKTYTKDKLQRLGLVQAFIDQPKLLLLHEPMETLTANSREVVKTLLEQARHYGTSAVIVSHNVSDIADVCDRIYHLNDQDPAVTISYHHA
ncbi:ABC transporter [Fictibacillus macauensis ZFHKF-1]|uniref:ABC transporter n=1 Tax=Fictibacillus macauensis ZFHKF-1 TaxID=1196324 RepID=I8J399_9BACL|nr:ATP-binding cassette domain-containing protein [Fictibacillus macauensis]EIT86236.1 ABC transporter [Fictibacillus macauensis ZFHKF-1]